jgi:hypothetical protein
VSGEARSDERGAGFAAGGLIRTALLAYLPLAIAAALTWIAASSDGTTFTRVSLLPAHSLPAWRFAVALGVAAAGTFAIAFAPGLLLMRALGLRLPNAVGNTVAAFVLSLASVSLAWIVAQASTPGVAHRGCLYLTVAALDAAALVAGAALSPGAPALPRLPARGAGRGGAELLVPAAGIVLMLAAGWLFMPGKVSIESLDEGATQVRGLGASLAYSALPEWDLGTGKWGFYPTSLFVAYPVYFSRALLGDTEAAVRIPALLFLGMMVLVTSDLSARGRTRLSAGSLNVLIPMLIVGYLSLQTGAYYAGHHPWHGDLGSAPLDEWVVTALAMGAFLLVRDGSPGVAAIAGLLSILAFPSGLPMIVLIGVTGLVAGHFEERRVLWRWGLALVALLLICAGMLLVYTVNTGTLHAMVTEWMARCFRGGARFGVESPARVFRALGWFMLMCGGLPFLAPVLTPLRHDRTTRWLALLGVAWVAFFALSPDKSAHYFLPAALLPMAVALRMVTGLPSRPALSIGLTGALVLSALVCVVTCAPRPVKPYVADRELGGRTIFLAASERAAVDYSSVLDGVMEPLETWRPGDAWTTGRRIWATYASHRPVPDRTYDFYVGPGAVPAPGLTEVAATHTPAGKDVKLWVRGGEETLRAWKGRAYPLRTELSRFDFDMARLR